MPFMSNVIQNVCTFDTLLTSHQLGWSVVPLQILMVPILTEATATLRHLEFVQYLTEWSLHVQRSVWQSHTTPAPVPCPAGVNLESEQENASSSRPKTSDPDSPETSPTPHSNPPVTLSKPPVTPSNLKQCHRRLLVQHQQNLKQCCLRLQMPTLDLQQHQRNAH